MQRWRKQREGEEKKKIKKQMTEERGLGDLSWVHGKSHHYTLNCGLEYKCLFSTLLQTDDSKV